MTIMKLRKRLGERRERSGSPGPYVVCNKSENKEGHPCEHVQNDFQAPVLGIYVFYVSSQHGRCVFRGREL